MDQGKYTIPKMYIVYEIIFIPEMLKCEGE